MLAIRHRTATATNAARRAFRYPKGSRWPDRRVEHSLSNTDSHSYTQPTPNSNSYSCSNGSANSYGDLCPYVARGLRKSRIFHGELQKHLIRGFL